MRAAWLTKKRAFWLLVGFIFVGAWLRLLGLSIQSLWWDELFSWWLSSKESLGDVLTQASRDVHPPAHPVILYLVERYLGDSEFWLRLASAVFGILSIPAMYMLAKRVFSRTEGVWAAALTTILWFPIYYSQEARSYSLLFLLCILSMTFWFPLFRAQMARAEASSFSIANWVLYVLCAIGMVYTHHYGSLMVALQGLALFSTCGTRLRAYCRTLLLYLPIVAFAIPAWFQAFGQYRINYLSWLPEPSFGLFTSAYYTFFNRSELVKNAAIIITVVPLIHLLIHSWKKRSLSVFFLLSIEPRSVDLGLLASPAFLRRCRGNAFAQAHADHPLSDCIRPSSLSSPGPRSFGCLEAVEDPDCGRSVVYDACTGGSVCG